MIENAIGIIGLAIGIIGLVYAKVQNNEKTKLNNYIRSQAWFLYGKANNANGTTQIAFELYKKLHQDNLKPEIIEQLAKADAFGQDVFKEVVRQIQLSEPVYTKEVIKRWVDEGRVSQKYFPLFAQLCVDQKQPANTMMQRTE